MEAASGGQSHSCVTATTWSPSPSANSISVELGHERGDPHAPKLPQGYDRAMKAAVIYENGGPDVLRYEDVPDPECPDGCVLLDVEAISIEGGDLLARAASPPPETPHIVGYLCAGTVVEVGRRRREPSRRRPGRGPERRRLARGAAGRAGRHDLARPRGARPCAAACIPVAFGTAHECLFTAANLDGGPDGAHPCGGGRRGDGRHPAGQAGRCDGDLHRLERREAGAPEAARARPRHQLRHARTSSTGCVS